VFVSVLVDGPLSLYQYRDQKVHFYVERGGEPEELLYYRKFREEAGRRVLSDSAVYRNQLVRFVSDCAHVLRELDELRFTRDDLKKMTAEYNECVSPGSNRFVRREKRIGIETGVVLGMVRSQLRVYESDFAASTTMAAGLSVTLRQARNRQRFSFRGELLWVRYRADYHRDGRLFRVEPDYLKLAALVRYTRPAGPVRPYVEAGLTSGWAVRYDSVVPVPQSQFEFDLGNAISEVRRLEQGVAVGIGVEFGNFDLLVRGERSNGFSDFQGIPTPVQYLSVYLGYRLGVRR
jgi:hypothetical protein